MQINKVNVREVCKDNSVFGFELERTGEPGRKRSVGPKEEAGAVVVHCDSEELRDEYLKAINDQIRELKNIGDILANPVAPR